MSTHEYEVVRQLYEHMQKMQQHPDRFCVRIIVSDAMGVRRQHITQVVNAHDAVTAVPIVMFKVADQIFMLRWDELHIIVEPVPSTT